MQTAAGGRAHSRLPTPPRRFSPCMHTISDRLPRHVIPETTSIYVFSSLLARPCLLLPIILHSHPFSLLSLIPILVHVSFNRMVQWPGKANRTGRGFKPGFKDTMYTFSITKPVDLIDFGSKPVSIFPVQLVRIQSLDAQ